MEELSQKRIEELLSQFSRLQIMVIGDIMVDKYIWGTGIRLSSEAPVPVIKVVREEYSPGGAANIAYHLANLGGRVHLCGPVGYDDAAFHLRSRIVAAGVEAGGVIPSNSRPTTQKIRIMSSEHSQLLSRFDYEKEIPLTEEESAPMIQYIRSYIHDIHLMVLFDYGRGVFRSREFIETLKELVATHDVLTVAQLRTENMESFSWVNYLLISLKRAKEYLEHHNIQSVDELQEVGRLIQHHVGIQRLSVCDPSRQVVSIFQNGEEVYRTMNHPAQVRDQTGLSDVASAILSMAFAAGATFEEAAILAKKGMSVAGSQLGTGKVLREHLSA